MKRRVTWIVLSGLMVLALLLSACAPAAEKEEAAPVKEATPVEEAAAVKEATPAEAEGMVRDSLGKLVDKPRYGGRLTFAVVIDPVNWDPEKSLNSIWSNPPYETLFQWDWTKGPAGSGEWDGLYGSTVILFPKEAGGPVETWELTDANTMVLHIRQGVHFQDRPPAYGREMDAYDVEAIQRWEWGSPRGYPAKNYPGSIAEGDITKAVYATDKWTVVIKSRPGMMGAVYDMVAGIFGGILAPREWVNFDMSDWRNSGGSGAFMVTDYVPGSSVTWQRNPNYWMKDPLHPQNQLPYLDGYKQLLIADASTRLAALRTGRLDLTWGNAEATGALNWEDAAQLSQSRPELKFKSFVGSGGMTISMRVDKPALPWHDVRVRRALAMAIDKQAIVDDYYGGHAELFGWPVSEGYDPRLGDIFIPLEEYPEVVQKMYGYYPQEAKQLLVEAGYPNGFKAEVLTKASEVDLLSVVAAYWQQNLNVELDIQVREVAVFNGIKARQAHKEMMAEASGSSRSSGLFKLANLIVSYSSLNTSAVNDPKVEETWLKFMQLYFDRPTRSKVARDFWPYLLEQAYFIKLPVNESTNFWHPWVHNYEGIVANGYGLSPSNSWLGNNPDVFKYIWLDQDLKQAMTGKK